MKKCFFIYFIIILSILFVGCATSDNEYLFRGNCGENVIWKLSEDGILSISGKGATFSYSKEEAAPWASYKNRIEEVTIADGITTVGSYLFYDLPALKTITMADSVTQIQSHCFYSCDKLSRVTLSSSVVALEESAFSYCTSLQEIVLPSTLHTIGNGCFSYCINLEAITSGKNVTFVGKDAFDGTRWLSNMPDGAVYFDAVLVKALNRNEAFISIDIPYGITMVSESACEGLQALQAVNFPTTIKTIGARAFYNTGLSYVHCPEALQTIGNDAFSSCMNLCYIRFNGSPVSLGAMSAADTLLVIAPTDSSVQAWAKNFTFMPSENVDEQKLLELVQANTLPTSESTSLADGVYTLLLTKVYRDRSVVLEGFLAEPIYFTYDMYKKKTPVTINGTEYAQVQMNDVVVFCPEESLSYIDKLYSLMPFAYVPTRREPSLIYLNNGCDYYCKKTSKVAFHCAAGAYLYPRTLYWGEEFYANGIYDTIDLEQLSMAEGYAPTKIREMDDFFFSGYGLYIWGLENKNEVQTQIIIQNNAVTAVIIPNV